MSDAPMNLWAAPWNEEVQAARSMDDLTLVWRKWSPGKSDATLRDLAMSLEVRKAELASEPSQEQQITALEALAKNENDSFQAMEDYKTALDRFARGHTNFKTIRAKKYIQLRDQYKTVSDTDNACDADPMVSDARMEAYIAEGLVKAAKSNLDRLERQFQYHRSLMVNERQVDSRPSAGGL